MVIELVVALATIIIVARVAEMEGESGVLWGGVTVVTTGLCLLIPLPFMRVLLGGAVGYLAMAVYKSLTDPD